MRSKNAASLSDLPTELSLAISGHLELEHLLVLSLTSHQLHAICLGWIYRAITMRSPVQALKCCKTIISRKEAADSNFPATPAPALLRGFYVTFTSAISRMMNVEVLDVSLQPILFGFFSHISFPLLCTCTLPVSSALLPFLCKNPTIRTLYTFSQGAAGSWNSILIPIQPIRMPRLETFSGPDAAVCSLVPGSLVSTVGIFWAKHRVIEISKIFAAVGSSRASVTQLNNLVSSWDLALPVHIAKHTPQIVFLQIRNVTDLLPTPAKLDFMCALDDTLRLLPCLATLVVAEGPESAIYRPIDSIVPGLESQFETVERWGEIAPALRRICLSTMFTSWGRVHDNVWFPGIPGADCPETFQCTKWLVKKALASRIPLLPTPYDVLAEHFAGVDEMAILRMAVARDGAVPAFNILWKDGKTVISYPSAAPTEILVAL